MHKLFRFLCAVSVLFCLTIPDAQATRHKSNEKSSKNVKQKQDSKSGHNAKNEREKKALADDKSKSKKGKKGEKEVAEVRGKHGKKDSSERKELSARDKKKLSRKEQQELARKERAEQETKSKKSRREEIAVNKKRAKESDSREVEQTRPHYAKPDNSRFINSRSPANTEKPSDRVRPSKLLPQPLPAVANSSKDTSLPAAHIEGIEINEERAKSPEAKLLPPVSNPNVSHSPGSVERRAEVNLAPAPSAKNTASSANQSKDYGKQPVSVQSKPVEMSSNPSRTTGERFPSPNVEVRPVPMLSDSKNGDLRPNPPQQRNDDTRLTPNQTPTNPPQQPRGDLSSDDTQQNPYPNSSRSGIPVDRVIEIQKALIKHGYLDGEPNGIYDDNTRQAMKRFQMANNLSATGLPSAHALKKLGVSKRREDGYAVPVRSSAQADKKP